MGRFLDAISGTEKISVIAEVKKYSPSYGQEFPEHDLTELVRAYELGGADAISVVTAQTPFRGSKELLTAVRAITQLPILRKDFLSTPEELDESASLGADAVLLIARDLESEKLIELVLHAQKKDLDLVIEMHSEEDVGKIKSILKNDAKNICIGINNRNLKDFSVDVTHALSLLEKVRGELPAGVPIIAESAFRETSQLALYKGKVDAALIGTALLISEDPEKKVREFKYLN